MAIGKVSGPLLQSNLTRDGVNLAVETDLLYFDVNNHASNIANSLPGDGRIGIKTNNPLFDLDVNGDARTVSITSGQLTVDDIDIDGSTIKASTGNLTLEAGPASSIIFRSNVNFTSNFETTELTFKVSAQNIARNEAITATVSNTPNQIVDQWPIATYRSCKYLIQVTNATGFQSSEMLVTHNGTTTFLTEYAVVETNLTNALFTSDINSGNVRLLVNATDSSTVIKIQRTLITI